jgi:3-oxoacyl-[acyl-carrier protein] reductase
MAQRVAVITGGVKGIGRAIALALADDGWSIAVCYRRSIDAANEIRDALREKRVPALVERCDVSDAAQCETFVANVRAELGGVDVLVNGAGPYTRTPLLEQSVESWHDMFDNNLHPVFYMSRLVAPLMIERKWGRIVNFSMANADHMSAQPMVTAHYIAKAGILILTRTFAKLLGPHNITVNAISPGFIASGSAPDEELAKMVKSIPAGYVGELSDCVAAVKFVLGDGARYVNGANIQLSGGWGV